MGSQKAFVLPQSHGLLRRFSSQLPGLKAFWGLWRSPRLCLSLYHLLHLLVSCLGSKWWCLKTSTAHFSGLTPGCRSPHFFSRCTTISLSLLLSSSYTYFPSPANPQGSQSWQLSEAFKDLSFPRVEPRSSVGVCVCSASGTPQELYVWALGWPHFLPSSGELFS